LSSLPHRSAKRARRSPLRSNEPGRLLLPPRPLEGKVKQDIAFRELQGIDRCRAIQLLYSGIKAEVHAIAAEKAGGQQGARHTEGSGVKWSCCSA